MNVTKHFSPREFQSPDGVEYPAPLIDVALFPLASSIELIRYVAGDKPVTIVSGFRTPAMNTGRHKSPRSRHLVGEAADIFIPGVSTAVLLRIVLRLRGLGLPWPYTYYGIGAYRDMRSVHIDIRRDNKSLWYGADGPNKSIGEAELLALAATNPLWA